MSFLDTILNIFFPTSCISCGREGAELCKECLSACPMAERKSENWIFPLYDYRHPPIKQAVWLLKYKGRKKLADIFAEVMYGRILEELSELGTMENFNNAVFVPVPLSRRRQKERGFNQAELICKKLVELNNGVNFQMENNILVKPKETTHQARIENRAERLKNIVDSFVVKNKERVAGRNIVLIDDVTTTGATLNEAKKI